ncbi:MAG: carboxypeptidase M32 [Alphaproteobacteria bacterium]|nr:carboxypeptidase M32 [Alphaproteobacteria bacterium]
MMPYASVHAKLENHFARLTKLEDVAAFLDWDTAAMMPPGGAGSRSEQTAALRAAHHELLSRPEVGSWLDEAEGMGAPEPWSAANLREMRRRWTHATAVPSDLVEALARAESVCETTWREARARSDFAMVRPRLAEVLGLVRQVARAKAERLGGSPYEALLDAYEPGGRCGRIDAAFAELEAFLPGFIAQALERQGGPPKVPPGPFPVSLQRELGLRLMGVLGFDFERGRLDVSHHPFCGGAQDDVRITTRYDEENFTSSLMGVLHETGHALYEMGLPMEWRWQPVGRARGMSVHESQSLLFEMQACRSRPFLTFAAPLMREAFGGEGPAWDADNLYRLYTRVRPDFIRVDADEVTYPAHVILRYRLEQALVGGAMEVDDLPAAWAEGMERLLGIVPPDDARGCLQDIHWYAGAWGYFPTYTLGAMTAAQLFDAACRADADVLPGIGRGDFSPLLRWLRASVHGKGSSLSTDELLTQATGRPLDPSVFESHLRRRYLG